MRELKFDGLSPDGTRLVLAGKDGQKWSVVIDERIEAAVRGREKPSDHVPVWIELDL